MKKLSAVTKGLFLFLVSFGSVAQENIQRKLLEQSSYKLEISNTKTSNIIFPYAIVSVDRGSAEILAQKATGVENILQVKAAKTGFTPSNLSVVTADGKLTTFVVSYVENPSSINLSIDGNAKSREDNIFLPKENINEAEVRKYAEYVFQNKEYTASYGKNNNGIGLNLKGLFIKDGILYFQFKVSNWSNISYDIDQFRFFIRDQRRTNRTASQEIEVLPIYVNKEPNRVVGRSYDIYVFALPKFTIPDQKYFAVQMMEKDGGRHLDLKIGNSKILRARPLR
ncbi:conjugative transposon protein TraN [Pedobacter sp.]